MALAALIPMIIGFIWYNKAVFGKAWMAASGMTDEKARGGNMPVIFGLSYVFSLFLAMAVSGVVIHQNGLFSLFLNDPASAGVFDYLNENTPNWVTNCRTFGHGAVHGMFTGLFVALPILATNAMFERKGFKYIAVNAGYWIVTLILMGGIICQFS